VNGNSQVEEMVKLATREWSWRWELEDSSTISKVRPTRSDAFSKLRSKKKAWVAGGETQVAPAQTDGGFLLNRK